jgi:hypothetical protein
MNKNDNNNNQTDDSSDNNIKRHNILLFIIPLVVLVLLVLVPTIRQSANAKTNTVIATIRVGPYPFGVVHDSTNKQVYVANTNSDILACIQSPGSVLNYMLMLSN